MLRILLTRVKCAWTCVLRTHTSSTYCVTCKLHLLCLVASNGVTDNLVKYEKKTGVKKKEWTREKKEDNVITGERERERYNEKKKEERISQRK